MVAPSFHISGWGDLAIIAGICTALASLFGGLLATRLNSRASRIAQRQADDSASDRLIRLIETEAEKKVQIVRTEFELKIAQMQLEHSKQLTAMREDFERQLKALSKEHDMYRCDHALECAWRFKPVPPPSVFNPS